MRVFIIINKQVFNTSEKTNLSFVKKIHFPMLIVCVHFLVKLLLAWVSRLCYKLVTGQTRVLIGNSSLVAWGQGSLGSNFIRRKLID